MGRKVEIQVCMGSSCFARGNNALLDTIEELIQSHGWQDKIRLSGLHCQNLCSEGPNVKIDEVLYQGLDSGALLDLLEKKLLSGSDGDAPPARYASVRHSASRKER